MRNIKKEIKPFVIMIFMVVGFEMQHASPPYQLIFLGIVIISLLYEIIKMKSPNRNNNIIALIVSCIISCILAALVVVGINYGNMNDNIEGIVLVTAFIQFVVTLIISGYRMARKSGDRKRIRKVLICSSLLVVIILLFVEQMFFAK